MDHFEQELARMMRDSREDAPYEARDHDRLRAAVRVRTRVRTARRVTGSVLAVAGLGVGLTFLTSVFAQGGPTGRQPRPSASAGIVPAPDTITTPARTSITRTAPRPGPSGSDR